MGRWHKSPRRCDYCHRTRKEVYSVQEGPTTGIFCGRLHYELARKHMEGKEEHDSSDTQE